MSGSPVLRVEGLRRLYGERVAVQGLDLELHPGQILGLLGPNGAGKTTSLRAIAGILKPSGGRVEVAGWELGTQPLQARRALAYVPDEPQLFEALTVGEHLMFTASVWGLTGWEPRAEALLARFELTDRRGTPCQSLSRGMRQKVALACAMLHEPPLLMLDEPMTGLDPLGMKRLKGLVREAVAAGAGAIVSSHQLELVDDLATHVLVLVDGEARFYGTLDALRALAPDGRTESAFFAMTGAVD